MTRLSKLRTAIESLNELKDTSVLVEELEDAGVIEKHRDELEEGLERIEYLEEASIAVESMYSIMSTGVSLESIDYSLMSYTLKNSLKKANVSFENYSVTLENAPTWLERLAKAIKDAVQWLKNKVSAFFNLFRKQVVYDIKETNVFVEEVNDSIKELVKTQPTFDPTKFDFEVEADFVPGKNIDDAMGKSGTFTQRICFKNTSAVAELKDGFLKDLDNLLKGKAEDGVFAASNPSTKVLAADRIDDEALLELVDKNTFISLGHDYANLTKEAINSQHLVKFNGNVTDTVITSHDNALGILGDLGSPSHNDFVLFINKVNKSFIEFFKDVDLATRSNRLSGALDDLEKVVPRIIAAERKEKFDLGTKGIVAMGANRVIRRAVVDAIYAHDDLVKTYRRTFRVYRSILRRAGYLKVNKEA